MSDVKNVPSRINFIPTTHGTGDYGTGAERTYERQNRIKNYNTTKETIKT